MIDLQQRVSLLSPKKRSLLALELNKQTTPNTNTKRLVAYIVPKQEQSPTNRELRDFLTSKLPEHMIPSAFVTLDNLPIMPNGKVNRRALPAPKVNYAELEKTFVAPRTATEEVLAEIWAKVLGLEKVGIHDNFFELGGHSLLATRVIFQVRDIFQVELPVQSLFEASSVAEFSQILLAQSAKPGQIEKIAQVFQKINAMPVEDIKQTLQERQKREVGV